jgi:hypothetical protein
VRPSRHINVPHARNAGLDAVRTRWAVWCDADDAFLPGRVDRLVQALKSGCSVATDAQELYDGKTGTYLRDLPIPGFLKRDADKARLFERNYLPGIGHIAFDTALGQTVRYDAEQFGGDDSDFFWRMISTGARVSFLHEKGYRMFAYPGSDSRNLARQRSMVARALRKHAWEAVKALYENAGFSLRITAWGLCSMAMFREEWEAARLFLEMAFPLDAEPREVLEPEGPWPLPEGWRFGFTRGTLHLLMDQPYEAVDQLESALVWHRSPDLLNNLGVANRMIQRPSRAKRCFEEASSLFPGYLDARINRDQEDATRITTHPLRIQPSRNDY